MKNSILEVYQDWLKNYCERNKSGKVKSIAEKLIKDLNKVTTLSEALALFSAIIENKQLNDSSLAKRLTSLFQKHNLIEENFYKKISEWQSDAKRRLSLIEEVEEKLNMLNPNIDTQSLITLLKNVVANKDDLLLNQKGRSLLECLYKSNLQATLNYLTGINKVSQVSSSQAQGASEHTFISEEIDSIHAECKKLVSQVSSSQTQGMFSQTSEHTFISEESIDSIHAECKKLVSKMAANFDERNKDWENLNSLLQTAIPIYIDINDSASPVAQLS
ncbi:Uncharacterised protein [Legionella beliardensis]|uniref:Uncharacterized protein n=1 Tax=Legionella beliardensis TaxID=91822 RepID=A0A378I4J7_9GAMM|nr:hypothetical protein [Legionella beliardensis]STX29933.1 Uncharacterised protein [Legionella beliardensis]